MGAFATTHTHTHSQTQTHNCAHAHIQAKAIREKMEREGVVDEGASNMTHGAAAKHKKKDIFAKLVSLLIHTHI
jgi:hypothetical protein